MAAARMIEKRIEECYTKLDYCGFKKGGSTMLIAGYGFLSVGAALSCYFAFEWLGMERRRGMVLSLIAGVICGLSVCLNLSTRMNGVVCFLFLAVFIPIVLEPKSMWVDIAAAVSIAYAQFGMLQVTAGTIFCIEFLSLYFRIMLIVLSFLTAYGLCSKMSGEFPGTGWQEYFSGQKYVDGDNEYSNAEYLMEKLGIYFALYAMCLVIPAAAGIYTIPVMSLEWFAFFGGFKLLNLMISNRKEKLAVLTEKQYRDDMQTYMSVIRSQRHDYNFHVQTLHGLLLRKDYEACESYLNELLKDSIEMNQILPVYDAAVSALILSFKNKAAQSGIHMDISIENDLSQIATSVYETNKVIGNLLQNAIDETEMIPDKSYGIRLSILKRGEFCIINVSNRVSRLNPMASYQVGHSSKKGHEGIGIASIQTLASKYGGVVYSRMEKDIIYFVAKLPLRLYKEET